MNLERIYKFQLFICNNNKGDNNNKEAMFNDIVSIGPKTF